MLRFGCLVWERKIEVELEILVYMQHEIFVLTSLFLTKTLRKAENLPDTYMTYYQLLRAAIFSHSIVSLLGKPRQALARLENYYLQRNRNHTVCKDSHMHSCV